MSRLMKTKNHLVDTLMESYSDEEVEKMFANVPRVTSLDNIFEEVTKKEPVQVQPKWIGSPGHRIISVLRDITLSTATSESVNEILNQPEMYPFSIFVRESFEKDPSEVYDTLEDNGVLLGYDKQTEDITIVMPHPHKPNIDLLYKLPS